MGWTVNQRSRRQSECPGDPRELNDAHLYLGTLHVADVVAVQSGKLRQDLLAPAALGAQHTDAPAELAGQGSGTGSPHGSSSRMSLSPCPGTDRNPVGPDQD